MCSRIFAPVGIMIAMLSWNSGSVAQELTLPPLGDVWITPDTSPRVRALPEPEGTIVLGDGSVELPIHQNANAAAASTRATTGVDAESRR